MLHDNSSNKFPVDTSPPGRASLAGQFLSSKAYVSQSNPISPWCGIDNMTCLMSRHEDLFHGNSHNWFAVDTSPIEHDTLSHQFPSADMCDSLANSIRS
ncbi:MAG: hypothetical protein HGB19_04015 [Chlorobiales bacterium]|nr:hypothetical protein [Chlorobiales bacterium]